MGLVVTDRRDAGGCYAICWISLSEIKAAQVQEKIGTDVFFLKNKSVPIFHSQREICEEKKMGS
jgi:hypothetical protein